MESEHHANADNFREYEHIPLFFETNREIELRKKARLNAPRTKFQALIEVVVMIVLIFFVSIVAFVV